MSGRVAITSAENYDEDVVDASVRRIFDMLGYDAENPLGHIVKPGNRVFIKPNWVAHQYRASCPCPDSVWSTITHPAVIRVMTRYVAKALRGKGEIGIGDNPSIDADFSKLLALVGLDDLKDAYDVPVRVFDLRPQVCADLRDYGKKHRMVDQQGDPLGSTTINLGKDSMLYGVNPVLFRGVFDESWETVGRHFKGRQEYNFSNSILDADVYISIPKLKTHHKVGATLNLKGMVGTCGNKNLLVHWRRGWPGIGGDEYPSFRAWRNGGKQKILNRGAWSGNDTIWRMVVDLYNAFNQHRERKTFSLVDGVVGGEANGPFCPRAKDAQVLLGGESLLSVDLAASRYMGFTVEEIPYLRHFMDMGVIDKEAIEIASDCVDADAFWDTRRRHLAFEPPAGWSNLVAQGQQASRAT